MEKACYDRQTPATSSDPKVSKEDGGARQLHLDCGNTNHWNKLPQIPYCCQDPAQTVDKQDTEELVALLCLDKIRSVPQLPPPQENLSDLLGLAAKPRCSSGISTHNEAIETIRAWWGEARERASLCHFKCL